MNLSTLFDNILDLPGVEGACLFALDGPVFLNRMPAFITDEVFSDAQRRIAAMYETVDENFLPCDDYLLKYRDHWLMIRRNEVQVLVVLAAESANLASTRMVTNMAMKHFTAEALAALQSDSKSKVRTDVPAPAAKAPPAKAPLEVAAAPEPKKADAKPAPATEPKKGFPVRMYRGKPY